MPGDWIITGIAGETYACKPDIFESQRARIYWLRFLMAPRDLSFQPLFQVLFGVHFVDLRSMRARPVFPLTIRYTLLSSAYRMISLIPLIWRRDSEEACVPLKWL